MSTEEIIEESKKRLSNGSDLLDISKFLNDLNIESEKKIEIINLLQEYSDKIKLNKFDFLITITKITLLTPISVYGFYLIYSFQFNIRLVIFPLILGFVCGIIVIIEIAKSIKYVKNKFDERN
ncbi:MAG: hypothetical protein ACK5WV_16450 [Chryseotalea sp.]|jgi:hypothetical protein|nr:hypothetical protein [Cytophagales bacterium]